VVNFSKFGVLYPTITYWRVRNLHQAIQFSYLFTCSVNPNSSYFIPILGIFLAVL